VTLIIEVFRISLRGCAIRKKTIVIFCFIVDGRDNTGLNDKSPRVIDGSISHGSSFNWVSEYRCRDEA
jgi:hypothetical protein